MKSGNTSEDEGDTVIKMRGLPWKATKEDITNFLRGCNIKDVGIQILLTREGRPSGEAFVDLQTRKDFRKALEFHKKTMGSRFIEIFESDRMEMESFVRSMGVDAVVSATHGDGDDEFFLRLRGLPYSCTKKDIIDFFEGLDIIRDGIIVVKDYTGKSSGDAFVKFASREGSEKALAKHKDRIGHRYIEVYKCCRGEYEAASKPPVPPPGHPPYHHYNAYLPSSPGHYGPVRNRPVHFSFRPTPYERYPPSSYPPYMTPPHYPRPPPPPPHPHPPSFARRGCPPVYPEARGYGAGHSNYSASGRHVVHMRGLPFKATQQDVMHFFAPLKPFCINLTNDGLGRPSGEAYVEFVTREESLMAMSRDKANMDHRYIELFLLPSSRPGEIRPPVPEFGRPFPSGSISW